MNTLLLVLAVTAGAAQTRTTPTPPVPRLCRVIGTETRSHIPLLVNITVTLAPGCPADGEARVVLVSDSGVTDPASSYRTLTPCPPAPVPDQPPTCTYTWRGVWRDPLPGVGLPLQNWRPYWEAASGRRYLIPTPPPP